MKITSSDLKNDLKSIPMWPLYKPTRLSCIHVQPTVSAFSCKVCMQEFAGKEIWDSVIDQILIYIERRGK